MHINYFYRNLKKFKDWIKESQKIRKIVIRKFAIFSFRLIFKKSYLNSLVPFFLVYSKIFNIRCSVENIKTISKLFFLVKLYQNWKLQILYLQFGKFSTILWFNLFKILGFDRKKLFTHVRFSEILLLRELKVRGFFSSHWSTKKILQIFKKYWKTPYCRVAQKRYNFAPGAANHTFSWLTPCKIFNFTQPLQYLVLFDQYKISFYSTYTIFNFTQPIQYLILLNIYKI